MTGTQSLSYFQLQEIWDQVGRIEIEARRSGRWCQTDQGRVYTGQPVTVVLHQREAGAKLVQVHRAFADTIAFTISRNGAVERVT